MLLQSTFSLQLTCTDLGQNAQLIKYINFNVIFLADTPEDSFEEEESIYVPVEMSSQGCEIITDPDMIKQTDIDSFIRSRFRNIKGLPLYEPWFAKKCLYEVECLLLNHYHIDGYFLVRPEFQGENVFLVLSVVFNEGILHYKIIQVIYV